MAILQPIPSVVIPQVTLSSWGNIWLGTVNSKGGIKAANSFDKKQGMDFGKTIDPIVAQAFATMLGGIQICSPINKNALLPPVADCVEVGDTRVVGGVRAQNYDVMYRPDGVRIAYDSKTLNDFNSLRKNWHNMVNDLASEATTVHTRYPYAIATFFVLIPEDIFTGTQQIEIIRTLERLNCRNSIRDEDYKAESIALVIWDPHTGLINPTVPPVSSSLRIETYAQKIEKAYLERYAGLPPH